VCPGRVVDFDSFFADSGPEMLARALVLSGNRQDAEDAVQDAYVEALVRWELISHYDNPGAWVYKLVRQRLWKAARRRARWSPLRATEAEGLRATEGDPERFSEAVLTLAALAKLPGRQRMVMVMHCLHQLEQQQIAAELGVSRGAVAASIFKARRSLEKTLGFGDTGPTGVDEPGSSLVRPDGAGPGGGRISRRRDPLAAALAGAVASLRRAGGDGTDARLAHVRREVARRSAADGRWRPGRRR